MSRNSNGSGNDGEWMLNDDNIPYDAPLYRLVKEDGPSYELLDWPAELSAGVNGDTWEARVHFRAFARLQLGSKWYRISNWGLYRVHFKFRKEDTNEASVGFDLNGDGHMDDVVSVWRDDGSEAAANNAGF